MSEEAMKRALEFIDSVKVHPTQIASRDALHDALHTAIEAAKKQDPYAHIYETDSIYGLHRSLTCRLYNGRQPDRIVPVYTHPPEPAQPAPVQEPMADDLIASYEKGFKDGAAQRQPLSEEYIIAHFKFKPRGDTGSLGSFINAVRFAEAAHDITSKSHQKNT